MIRVAQSECHKSVKEAFKDFCGYQLKLSCYRGGILESRGRILEFSTMRQIYAKNKLKLKIDKNHFFLKIIFSLFFEVYFFLQQLSRNHPIHPI